MEIKNYFAQDAQGNIMPSANCYLYLPGTTTLATGLVDGNGVPISNPFLASSIGQVTFGAPNGVYDLRISQGARDTTIEIQCADLLQALNETASFLGAKSSAPTTRNDGSALQIADRYFNTSDQLEYLYKSTGWVVNNLDGQLIATSQGASLVGAVMQDGSTGTVQQAITSGDTKLRQDLIGGDGAKMIGHNRSFLSASIANAAQVFDADSINIREKRFTDLITYRPDPDDYKTWDWQPAVQGAISYLYDLAFSALRVGAIPDICVTGALYKMRSSVTMYPWMHIRSIGNVTFDFTGAPANSDGFVIHNELSWTNTGTGYSVSGSGSACLNGANGTILILGAGQETVTGRALVIGNTVGGKDPCRDGRVANVYVRGWQVAVDFQTFSTYLWSFHDCRLENNKYNVRTPVSNTNSGERMEFYNCNLSGSGLTGSSIYHRGGSYDIHFVGCSLDFVQDVVLVDGGNYSSLNFTDCHFEAWDGYLVNVVSGGGYFSVNIIQSTGYPSHYRDTRPGLNSSGRPLFYANAGCSLQVNLQTSRLSLSQPCFSEGPFVSGGAGDIRVKVSSPTRYAFNYAGTAIDQGVKDWNFQTDAVDTLATALTGWTFDNTSSVTVASSKLVLDGAKKVLQVVGTSDASYCQLTSKDKVPVRPGDLVFSWSAVSRIGLTSGTTNLQCRVVWYDSAGAVLLIPPLWNTVAMKTVFDSDQLPNFSEGNARYIAGEPQPYFAPPGAAFVAFRGLFTSFTGNLLISRASVWVSR